MDLWYMWRDEMFFNLPTVQQRVEAVIVILLDQSKTLCRKCIIIMNIIFTKFTFKFDY